MNVDDEAFEKIVDAFYPLLYRFALSLARQQEEACDLTQETFRRFAAQKHQLRDLSKAKTWLFTTLYREFLRGNKERNRLVPLVACDSAATDNPPPSTSADAATAVQALMKLDEVYRAPLVLFYLREHSYAEISEILGIPMGTVMSRISRGRDILRQLLGAVPDKNSKRASNSEFQISNSELEAAAS